MGLRTKYLCLFAASMLGTAVSAEQWFDVAGPSANETGTHVEVDLDSVRVRGQGGGEGVIRVTYDLLQPHAAGFRYRSFVANAQFDCQRRNIALTNSVYHAQPGGKGQRLGADSSDKETGMLVALLDSIPAAARRALLRATCATTRTPAA